MRKFTKILLFSLSLTGLVFVSYADRGISKKSKSKVSLNINTNHGFKSDLSNNLMTGLKYKGSLNGNCIKDCSHFDSNSLLTYQKGNSIYIIPVKQKVVSSDSESGATGMKLIIKAS